MVARRGASAAVPVGKACLIGGLALAQYLPLLALYGAVPAVLRARGTGLAQLGLFGLPLLVFSLNVLWAPLVDRVAPLGSRMGVRRGWIALTHLAGMAVTTIVVTLDPGTSGSAWPLLLAALFMAVTTATQRVATLGLAAELLKPAERSWGSTAGGVGAALGTLGGTAGTLWAIDAFGWAGAISGLLATQLALGLLCLCVPELPPAPGGGARPNLLRPFRRPGVVRMLAEIMPGALALGAAASLLAPWLVDRGLPLQKVGLTVGLAALGGFLIVGPVLSGWVAGRKHAALTVGSGLAALACVMLTVLTPLPGTPLVGAIGAAFVFIAFSAFHVAAGAGFFALAAEDTQAGTDAAVLTAALTLQKTIGTLLGGVAGGMLGYSATFAACAAVAVSGFLLGLRRPA